MNQHSNQEISVIVKKTWAIIECDPEEGSLAETCYENKRDINNCFKVTVEREKAWRDGRWLMMLKRWVYKRIKDATGTGAAVESVVYAICQLAKHNMIIVVYVCVKQCGDMLHSSFTLIK